MSTVAFHSSNYQMIEIALEKEAKVPICQSSLRTDNNV
jgi:hypothetical protein